MTRKIRTLGIDGGKNNTWWGAWEGHRFVKAGHLPTPQGSNIPTTLDKLYEPEFQLAVLNMLSQAGIEEGDDVIVERYQYRPGFGANSIEIVNHINAIIMMQSLSIQAHVHVVQASTHKKALVDHEQKFPVAIIKKVAERYGQWRPRLKRHDPNPHMQDAMTLGCWRILRREGKL